MPAEHKKSNPHSMDSKSAHHVNKKIKSNPINHAPKVKNIWTQPKKASFDGFASLSSPSPVPLRDISSATPVKLTSIPLSTPTSPSSPPPPSVPENNGTILTGSSLPIPSQGESNSSSSSSPSIPVLGGVISGLILLLVILLYSLYRKIRKTKRQRMAIGHHHHPQHVSDVKDTKDWNQTQTWSSIGSTTSSKFNNEMNAPPPAYCCTNQTKKRWTQDSVISKQASFVKQYSPQLAYSPSNHSILQMDPDGISPSHTLVDTSGAAWLHQKDLQLPEYDTEQQQRRSIQPYQAQLDISSSSFSDALEAPGPYQSGILLHTKEFCPSSNIS